MVRNKEYNLKIVSLSLGKSLGSVRSIAKRHQRWHRMTILTQGGTILLDR